MDTDFDDLKSLWKESKQDGIKESADVDILIEMGRKKMKSTIKLQWSSIAVLFLTLMVISAFFKYVAHFRQTLSFVGMWFMMGGLIVRIGLELISIYLSVKVDLTDNALKSNNAALNYVVFRKRMNGPVTIGIVILYSVGFYLLTPEFSLYFNRPMLLLMNLSYLLAAAIFIWSIRKAVKKEMALLQEMILIQKDITRKFSE